MDKERITIHKLAEMVVNEFQGLREEMAGGFRGVRETLADHSDRLNRIERKLELQATRTAQQVWSRPVAA